MKRLVTGGAGYTGSPEGQQLLEGGHEKAVPEGIRFLKPPLRECAGTVLGDGRDGVFALRRT